MQFNIEKDKAHFLHAAHKGLSCCPKNHFPFSSRENFEGARFLFRDSNKSICSDECNGELKIWWLHETNTADRRSTITENVVSFLLARFQPSVQFSRGSVVNGIYVMREVNRKRTRRSLLKWYRVLFERQKKNDDRLFFLVNKQPTLLTSNEHQSWFCLEYRCYLHRHIGEKAVTAFS